MPISAAVSNKLVAYRDHHGSQQLDALIAAVRNAPGGSTARVDAVHALSAAVGISPAEALEVVIDRVERLGADTASFRSDIARQFKITSKRFVRSSTSTSRGSFER